MNHIQCSVNLNKRSKILSTDNNITRILQNGKKDVSNKRTLLSDGKRVIKRIQPRMAEEAAKELSFDIESVKAGKWYDRTEMYKYINKASPEARRALAKRVFPTVKENTPLLDDCEGPIDVIRKMNETSALTNKGDVLPEYNVLELDGDRAKIQVKNNWIDFPDIEEGQLLGIFQMFKILKVHANTTKVSDNELIMEVKWEN